MKWIILALVVCFAAANENATLNCTRESETAVLCEEVVYEIYESERVEFLSTEFWLFCLASLLLVLFAGLMSGLTIGLMAIPMMELEILKNSGTEKERKYAAKLIPVLKKHHLVLVTLLLSNAAAMETLPLALDRISSPIVAIFLSVTLVLFFGEIIPQALILKFGLAIGANLAPILRGLMILLFPIAWPISKVLDRVFGEDDMEFYDRRELKGLVDLHHTHGGALSIDEVSIIKGALDMTNKTGRDCMTPIESVFKLPIDAIFDKETKREISKAGHSRIPVYDTAPTNLVGVILLKNCFLIPENTPVKDVLATLPSLPVSTALYDLLNECQTGKSHLIALYEEQPTEAIGIVTLEDVIEELLGEEILDENDVKKVENAQLFLRRVSEYVAERTSMSVDRPRMSVDRSRGIQTSKNSRKSSKRVARGTAPLLSDD